MTPRGAREAVISGGLLRIQGMGVLIIGDSGVGKSESALELIARGHRFISDDVVHVRKDARGRLIGRAPKLSRFFMEIRGLGIIHIRETFGPRSIAHESSIELVVRLKRWERRKEYDRLGLRVGGVLKRAALMLYGKQLLPHYPQCLLKMGRFRGTEITGEIVDNRQEYMNAFAMVREGMAFLERTLPLGARFPEGKP